MSVAKSSNIPETLFPILPCSSSPRVETGIIPNKRLVWKLSFVVEVASKRAGADRKTTTSFSVQPVSFRIALTRSSSSKRRVPDPLTR